MSSVVTSVAHPTWTAGVSVNTLQAAHGLHARGHTVDLVHWTDGELLAEFATFCRHIRKADPLFLYPSRHVGGQLKQMVRLLPAAAAAAISGPDAFWANEILSCGWASAAKAMSEARLICHVHSEAELQSTPSARILNRVDRFVAVSDYVAQCLHQYVPDKKIRVIHNGVDTKAYRPPTDQEREEARRDLGIPDGAFAVLFVGRLEHDKGVHVLTDAWSRLGLPASRGRLLLVGVTDESERSDYVVALRRESSRSTQFFRARQDVQTFYHAADVLVLPSLCNEALGRVLIEAMSTGCPVLGSAVGGIPEVLSGTLGRFLFPRGDATSLAGLLRDLQDWRSSTPRLGEECRRHAATTFDLDRVVDRLEDLLTGRD